MAAPRPAPKKRPAPPTYGGEQGYQDRRVPFVDPWTAIKKIWNGGKAPKTSAKRQPTKDGNEP